MLGGSIFAEECKGDFTAAATRASAILAAAHTVTERADASIVRALVHILQGEPPHASTLLDSALTLVPADANRTLRAMSHALHAMHQQFNIFPDGNGVGAVEVTTRWSGASELLPLDTRWHAAMQQSSDAMAQWEAWIVYSFQCQLLPARYMLEGRRYAPESQPLEQMLAMTTGPATQLHNMATQMQLPSIGAFADWAAADLHRRAGDLEQARVLLERAQRAAHDVGDAATEALCLMTTADWACAPFSSPINWNFAVADSSSAASNLSVQIETEEGAGGTFASYDRAAELFRQAGATRGLAAIAIRACYLATLQNEWSTAAAHAQHARDLYEQAGDHRGAYLAATHLLMCQISGAAVPGLDAIALATDVGAWGATSGSFSFAVGLGILINRLARHWMLRRGHYERALACSQAALALFEALGASINATQCRVDLGIIHQAVAQRSTALTYFERALDDYTALIPANDRVATNLRQRVVFLATDVYQLALQNVDGDAMERAATRLQAQLQWLPDGAALQDVLAKLMAQMAAVQAGDATEMPAEMTDMPALAALRQMAESVVRQSSVLSRVYRSRAERRRGSTTLANQLLDRATEGLSTIPDGERHFLGAVVLAERHDYAAAAESMRAHVRAGGANAGVAGQLTDVMASLGGEHGAAEAALQQRRTHEQAFSAFVMVRAYDDAYAHLLALEQLAGTDWWTDDTKPWQPLCDMGELFEARNEAVRARECYDRAIDELEKRRAFLSRDELKVALASDKGAQYLYFLAARAAVRVGDAALGFDYAERGKARALLDLMADGRGHTTAHEAPAALAWREAAMQIAISRGLLAHARSTRSPDAGRVAALEAQVSREDEALHDAERALAAVSPQLHDAVSGSGTPMRAPAVCAALPTGTVLLEYFMLGDDLLAWALRRDVGVVAYRATIDTSVLARDIRALHLACEAREPWESMANGLSEILLRPFRDEIRAATDVIVVAHGAAHALPFHVLPFDGAPLGVNRTVTYLPSASALQWIAQEPVGPLPERILVVGNPSGDLPSAGREAEFVAKQFGDAILLLEGNATEAAVRQYIAYAPLVHFATHGTLDEETALNSCVVLADNARLTVYDLMLLRLQARLVVLSACSTGQGETTGGDDVLGLTRGLLAAGARAAVVSLWPVDDDSTAYFMQAFYRAMREGHAPRAALQRAQQVLREIILPEQRDELAYAHPYYWAPFVLVGQGA